MAEAIRNFRKNNAERPDIDRTLIDKGNTITKYLTAVRGGYWQYKNSIELIGRNIILGVAAVWEERKGLKDIIRLSELTDAQIIIVGVNEKQKEAIPDSIIAYSRTDNVEELRKLYAVADIYINTTYEDNYPTTNLEAVACGTPVLTYNSGGSPESAKIFGTAVPKGRIDLIAALIESNVIPPKTGSITTRGDMLKAYLNLF